MLNSVKIAAAQFDVHILDKAYNLDKMEEMSRRAKTLYGADLVAFPEASLAGYCFESREEALSAAEAFDGPSVRRMSRLSGALGMTIVFGTAETAGDRLYNSAVCCLPDGQVRRYRKTHLPLLGLDRFADPGDALCVVNAPFGKLGLLVCYDLRFPEPMREEALRGAELVVHITNLPPAGNAYPDFFSRARACENRVFLLSSNRIGTERGFQFIGRSQILDPTGAVLAELTDCEGIIAADINLQQAGEKDIIVRPGVHEMHLFRDRRPELYGNIGAAIL
ncbi:carbon-nitrogen hydrolase family protein [Pseudoflavonifractor phocaeensis]|uniref:carbon-nitrogen hydrolase family protein n=1 Tax=Pseudoflavonifractor phocaeensis TaxID=1870988 RepID=UPI00210869F3|nr:carbon-nitrogen hydrolase family protein [Pseudoflavonifractor phocaeensis]